MPSFTRADPKLACTFRAPGGPVAAVTTQRIAQEYRPAPPDKAPKSSHRNHTAHTLGIYAIGMPQNHGPWNSASTTLPPLRGFVASCETIQTTFPTGHMTKPLICINAHKKPGAMVNLHVCTRVRHIG